MLSFVILTPTTTPFFTAYVFTLLNRLRAISSPSECRPVSTCCVYIYTFFVSTRIRNPFPVLALFLNRVNHALPKKLSLSKRIPHRVMTSNTISLLGHRLGFNFIHPIHRYFTSILYSLTLQRSLTKFNPRSGDSRQLNLNSF